MKLNKEQKEILEDIFTPCHFEHPVRCRFCNEVMEEANRLAHLNTFHIEFSAHRKADPEIGETIAKLHDEAIQQIEKIEDEKQRSLDRYGGKIK